MKAIRILMILLILITVHGVLMAGGEKKKKEKKKDPEYIEPIDFAFAFYPTYNLQSTMLTFTDKNDEGKKIVYRPNQMGSVTLGAHYSFISLSYTFQIPQNQSTIETYGKTKYDKYALNIQMRSLGLHFYYQRFKGLYQDGSSNVFPSYKSKEPLPLRPDIENTTVGLLSNIIFSRSFSLKAAFEQSERQKKSKGAPLLMIAYRYSHLSADSAFIPTDQAVYYPDLNGFDEGTFNSLILAPGFGFSLVKGHFSVTPVVLIGSGLQIQAYRLEDSNKLRLKFPSYMNVKCAFGYNGNSLYTRIVFALDSNSIPFMKSATAKLSYVSAQFCLGVRF